MAMTVERFETVPYAKPCWVTLAPPIEPMLAFMVTVEVEVLEAAEVVIELTVMGVTGLDALEALLVPMMLVAVTVNVYGVPLTRPVTV